MAGHSKWANIQHRKSAQDARRGKLFTKLIREITVSARQGGGDAGSNPRLRAAIDKALSNNMTRDTVDRAIKRGTGELEGGELIDAIYEAYGPHGVGILVQVVTDNRNRAVADVRHAVNKYGGTMAEAGAVSWQFTRKGYIGVTQAVDQDELFMIAADAGAEDVQFNDGLAEIYVELESFQSVQLALEAAGIAMEDSSLIYDPNNPVTLDQGDALQVMNLIERIEDLDDVQNVYSTLELTDEAIAAMEGA